MKAFNVKLDCSDDPIIIIASSAIDAAEQATKFALQTYAIDEVECEKIEMISDEVYGRIGEEKDE